MIQTPTHRRVIPALLLLALGLLLIALTPHAARAAAQPGVVDVKGTTFPTVHVNLESDLGSPTLTVPGQSGRKGWPLREILLFVEDKTKKFDINGFDKDVVVSRTDSKGDLDVDRVQVADSNFDKKLPIYYLDDQGQTAMRDPSGGISTYSVINPEVLVPKSTLALSIAVSPDGPLTLKAGQTQKFKAKVTNPAGSAVTLKWSVDGDLKQKGTSVSAGRFEYEFDKEGTFQITVYATAPNAASVIGVVDVTVGKAKTKPPKKDKSKDSKDDEPEDVSSGSTPYVPGYTGGTGGGYGGGTPSPSSSNAPRKKKQDQPAVSGSGGDTVSGQLIDPNVTATVIPSGNAPDQTTEEANPGEGSGGGVPDGAKAALGIGALLGLGGLAEAGAFTGFFRRLRYRL